MKAKYKTEKMESHIAAIAVKREPGYNTSLLVVHTKHSKNKDRAT